MSELHDVLERADRAVRSLPTPGLSVDDVVRLHSRRTRRRRVATATVALAFAAAGFWLAASALRGVEHGSIPGGRTIDPITVQHLRLRWSAPVGTVDQPTRPVVAGGLVFVNTDRGLAAYAARCAGGNGACSPRWTAPTGAGGSGPLSDPVVSDGMVFVVSDHLSAVPVACRTAGGVCSPSWTSAGRTSWRHATVTADGDTVYVSADRLYAFPATCAKRTCGPTWVGTVKACRCVGSFGAVAAGDGTVVVSGDDLYAFPANCGTGGASCRPTWRTDSSSGGVPVIADGVVFVSTFDRLSAFPVGCATGGALCEPVWTVRPSPGVFVSAPEVWQGVVYVSTDRGYGYSYGCVTGRGACRQVWRSPEPTSAGFTKLGWWHASVADGMVWGGADRLYAFPARCAAATDSDRGSCASLWRGPAAASGTEFSVPTATSSALYVTTSEGRLLAFGLPAH
jgi:outer membrane protein assembly factor BamB